MVVWTMGDDRAFWLEISGKSKLIVSDYMKVDKKK